MKKISFHFAAVSKSVTTGQTSTTSRGTVSGFSLMRAEVSSKAMGRLHYRRCSNVKLKNLSIVIERHNNRVGCSFHAKVRTNLTVALDNDI
jgi:hypothetical protein